MRVDHWWSELPSVEMGSLSYAYDDAALNSPEKYAVDF